MKTTDAPITVYHDFHLDSKRMWQLITEPEHMRQWFFEQIPDFKAEVGFNTCFDISNESRVFPHNWTINEVIPESKLIINWNYPNYKGDSDVIFDIEPLSEGCRLTVTTLVLEDYPDDIPEFKRESCLGGWNYFIKERLPKYIDSLS